MLLLGDRAVQQNKKQKTYDCYLEAPSRSGGKFWTAVVQDKRIVMQWGKIMGRKGPRRSLIKQCDTASEARSEWAERVQLKLARGYRPVSV